MKTALVPILGLVFKIRILNFFYYAIFGSVILKLFKNGLFCFVILKLILKNISNSFYKGIGGILK
ncbi:hypothetical protein D2C89_07115 [Helicobacter pylori]|nr:hypothetical protein D2C89_07115 [Helicobacter pylori]QEE99328.1 hypothetical protein D2C88_06490 [Helicobacter pylori]